MGSPPTSVVTAVGNPKELQKLKNQTDQLREAFDKLSRAGWYRELQEAPAQLADWSRHLTDMMDHAPTAKGIARLNAYNARRAHMLITLWDLWSDIGGQKTGKATEAFLHACLERVLGYERNGHKGHSPLD